MAKRVILRTLFWVVIWVIIGTISFGFVGTIIGAVIGIIGRVIVGVLGKNIESTFSGKEIIVEGVFWAIFLPLCGIAIWGFWVIGGVVTAREVVINDEISSDKDFVPLLWFFIVMFWMIVGAVVGGISGIVDKMIFGATAK